MAVPPTPTLMPGKTAQVQKYAETGGKRGTTASNKVASEHIEHFPCVGSCWAHLGTTAQERDGAGPAETKNPRNHL